MTTLCRVVLKRQYRKESSLGYSFLRDYRLGFRTLVSLRAKIVEFLSGTGRPLSANPLPNPATVASDNGAAGQPREDHADGTAETTTAAVHPDEEAANHRTDASDHLHSSLSGTTPRATEEEAALAATAPAP